MQNNHIINSPHLSSGIHKKALRSKGKVAVTLRRITKPEMQKAVNVDGFFLCLKILNRIMKGADYEQ
jgi:hypothetical protein